MAEVSSDKGTEDEKVTSRGKSKERSTGPHVGEGAAATRVPVSQKNGEPNVVDFDDESLARFYADAIPAPEKVLTDKVSLSDERRYDVPVVAVCPEYTADQLREWVKEGHVSELAAIHDVEYVDLPGGHWPQLTQPDELAQVIVDQAERTG